MLRGSYKICVFLQSVLCLTSTELDQNNTLGLFKPTRIPVNVNLSEAVSLSRQSSNVFPTEYKEDEILSHTTLLFLLRSKSPPSPSGVNKGRCSKWYANWKEKKKLYKSTRQPCISDTSHLKRKFLYLGWNSKWGLALPLWGYVRRFLHSDSTKPLQLQAARCGRTRRESFSRICLWIRLRQWT